MATYNAQMNGRIYAAADQLTDEERRSNGGAYWKSVHGTLNHILWADQLWMSRFTGEAGPSVDMALSDRMFDDFESLRAARAQTDRRITLWAREVTEAWLQTDLVWFSLVMQRELRATACLLATHLFNHQTHHRGQAHALITRLGKQVGDTDLFLVVPMSQMVDPL